MAKKRKVEEAISAQAELPEKVKKPKRQRIEESASATNNEGALPEPSVLSDETGKPKKSNKSKDGNVSSALHDKIQNASAGEVHPTAGVAEPPASKKPKKPKKNKTEASTSTGPQGGQVAVADATQEGAADPLPGLTPGEKRQAKSERRTKFTFDHKLRHTRDMALERNAKVAEKKKERKLQRKNARLVPIPPPTAPIHHTTEALASGSDFVPLFTEDTNPTPVDLNGDAVDTTDGKRIVMNQPDGSQQEMLLLPRRSRKGLTPTTRAEKMAANAATQAARTASKKGKKAKKRANINPDPIKEDTTTTAPDSTSNPTPTTNSTDQPATDKTHRFILFIGNIPFTTTTPTLASHFSALQPFTLRHSTDKSTGKSKGFAFIEFEGYDKMKTCLKLYHHSYFNPETAIATSTNKNSSDKNSSSEHTVGGPSTLEDFVMAQEASANRPSDRRSKAKDKGRRINVELTAGGGGSKAKGRKEKIEVKNRKLAEERERRAKGMAREKEKERREKGAKGPASGANAEVGKVDGAGGDGGVGRGDVHPSRMSRVKG